MGDYNNYSGFREVAHTADVALKVRGNSIEDLFIQAALGMHAIMKMKLANGKFIQREIFLKEVDIESLLVSFLSELIFYAECGEGFNKFEIGILHNKLRGKIIGKEINSIEGEVKAITFHRLKIEMCKSGYETLLVFDV